jgi:hypothetical protein
VTRIVFAVFVVLSLVGLGTDLFKTGFTGARFVLSIGEWFASTLSGLITALGYIVLSLVIIERTSVGHNFEKEFKEWNPEDLKSEPDPDKIDLPDHIATIIFTVLGLVVLNLYPNLVAIRYASDGTWVSLPVFTDGFFHFLPWINIMGMIQIIFNGFLLGQKIWTPVTRILSSLLDVAAMILAIAIFQTPGIFGITSEALASIGLAESADELSRLFNLIPTIVITVIVVVTGIKLIKSLLRLFGDKTKSPYWAIK